MYYGYNNYIFKLLYFCIARFNIIFILISITLSIIPLSPIFAGGGDPPPQQACTPEFIKDHTNKICKEGSCLQYQFIEGENRCGDSSNLCDPYKPKLPSWEDVRRSNKRIYSINIDLNTTPSSGYTILDASLFSDYISCNKYTKDGYVSRGENLSGGRYCNKLVVGISNDYMNSIVKHGPKSLRPNIDIKVFCDDIITSSSFDHNDPITGRSYILKSNRYVCRDGSIHYGDGSCKVATEYKMKYDEHCVHRECRYKCECENVCSDPKISNEDCEESGGSLKLKCNKYCHKSFWDGCNINDTTYDTSKIDLTYYDVSICHQHYITDKANNISILETYDPNLLID